ncbi:Retrovirus-related Pol polyprotein from transposon [Dictyocoela muelleri]|nr:Retrovirus-related Pol polyprotein from transposon [Dictyocoela muelleri]
MNDKFILETDASLIGIGAVLKQGDNTIAYISRVLKCGEKNYTVMERETLAALWAMEKLEFYLIGKKFTLISDHKALEELHKKKEFGTPRVQRWLERFSKFDFDICYREGSKLLQSDALSREAASLTANYDCDDLSTKILKIHNDNGHRKKYL